MRDRERVIFGLAPPLFPHSQVSQEVEWGPILFGWLAVCLASPSLIKGFSEGRNEGVTSDRLSPASLQFTEFH